LHGNPLLCLLLKNSNGSAPRSLSVLSEASLRDGARGGERFNPPCETVRKLDAFKTKGLRADVE
jgi:hypothetical protein